MSDWSTVTSSPTHKGNLTGCLRNVSVTASTLERLQQHKVIQILKILKYVYFHLLRSHSLYVNTYLASKVDSDSDKCQIPNPVWVIMEHFLIRHVQKSRHFNPKLNPTTWALSVLGFRFLIIKDCRWQMLYFKLISARTLRCTEPVSLHEEMNSLMILMLFYCDEWTWTNLPQCREEEEEGPTQVFSFSQQWTFIFSYVAALWCAQHPPDRLFNLSSRLLCLHPPTQRTAPNQPISFHLLYAVQ